MLLSSKLGKDILRVQDWCLWHWSPHFKPSTLQGKNGRTHHNQHFIIYLLLHWWNSSIICGNMIMITKWTHFVGIFAKLTNQILVPVLMKFSVEMCRYWDKCSKWLHQGNSGWWEWWQWQWGRVGCHGDMGEWRWEGKNLPSPLSALGCCIFAMPLGTWTLVHLMTFLTSSRFLLTSTYFSQLQSPPLLTSILPGRNKGMNDGLFSLPYILLLTQALWALHSQTPGLK